MSFDFIGVLAFFYLSNFSVTFVSSSYGDACKMELLLFAIATLARRNHARRTEEKLR